MANRYKNPLLDRKRPAPAYCTWVEPDIAYEFFEKQRGRDDDVRLQALFDHYKLASNDYRGLATALARDFVPGFQYIQRSSQNTPNLKDAADLVGWVARKLSEGSANPSQALAALLEAGEAYESVNDDTLHKQYTRAIKHLQEWGYPTDQDLLFDLCKAQLDKALDFPIELPLPPK